MFQFQRSFLIYIGVECRSVGDTLTSGQRDEQLASVAAINFIEDVDISIYL